MSKKTKEEDVKSTNNNSGRKVEQAEMKDNEFQELVRIKKKISQEDSKQHMHVHIWHIQIVAD